MAGTCDLRFSLQNRYVGDRLAVDLDRSRISSRSVTVSGVALRAGKTVTLEEFVGADVPALRASFTRFLARHELPRAEDLVVLDLEPSDVAPRHLGTFSGREQRDHIAAYRRRVRVARQVLREAGLPGLRLALYQVIVPDGRGEPTEAFEERMRGYSTAGEQGMYDDLDAICPVLYQRFGPDDADDATLRRWVDAAARQALVGSLSLRRRDGTPIPLAPILSFWVFNGRSRNNRQAVTPESVARQLGVVQQSAGVATIVFWSGWQTRAEMETADEPVEPIGLGGFLDGTAALPWPGCE
jgi:hypothetical protein